jgi:2-polyprenyl-6-hydroxyphenyl methylase/3-demethylubiquinone-9 3-methyltransferase
LKNKDNISGYRYADAGLSHSHGYLLPALLNLLESMNLETDQRRIFELGCGNGAIADQLTRRGFNVTGVDPSEEGIVQANRIYPDLKLYQGSAYDDLAGRFGRFPVVISLEVVEHVYFPRQFAAALFDLVQPGGGGGGGLWKTR